jgi:hypothetical protein
MSILAASDKIENKVHYVKNSTNPFEESKEFDDEHNEKYSVPISIETTTQIQPIDNNISLFTRELSVFIDDKIADIQIMILDQQNKNEIQHSNYSRLINSVDKLFIEVSEYNKNIQVANELTKQVADTKAITIKNTLFYKNIVSVCSIIILSINPIISLYVKIKNIR